MPNRHLLHTRRDTPSWRACVLWSLCAEKANRIGGFPDEGTRAARQPGCGAPLACRLATRQAAGGTPPAYRPQGLAAGGARRRARRPAGRRRGDGRDRAGQRHQRPRPARGAGGRRRPRRHEPRAGDPGAQRAHRPGPAPHDHGLRHGQWPAAPLDRDPGRARAARRRGAGRRCGPDRAAALLGREHLAPGQRPVGESAGAPPLPRRQPARRRLRAQHRPPAGRGPGQRRHRAGRRPGGHAPRPHRWSPAAQARRPSSSASRGRRPR